MENDLFKQNALLNEFYYNERDDQTLDELIDWLISRERNRNVAEFINVKAGAYSQSNFVIDESIMHVSGIGIKKDLRFYSLIQLALISGYLDKIDGALVLEIGRNLKSPAIQRFCINKHMLLPLILFIEQDRNIRYEHREDYIRWQQCFHDFFDIIIGMQQDNRTCRYLKVYNAVFFHKVLNENLQGLIDGQIQNKNNPDLISLVEGFFNFLNFLPALSNVLNRSVDNVMLHSGFLHYVNEAFPIGYLQEWLPNFVSQFIIDFDILSTSFYKTTPNEFKREIRMGCRRGIADLNEILFSLKQMEKSSFYDPTTELFEDYFAGDLVLSEFVR